MHCAERIGLTGDLSIMMVDVWWRRSSEYCSDVGKMINCPVLRVNSDHPEAVWPISSDLHDGCLYSAEVSQENRGTLWGPLGGRMGRLKVVRLKMTSERRACLGLADVKRLRGPYFGCRDVKSASAKWKFVSRNKVSDWQMNAWTLQTCDISRAR